MTVLAAAGTGTVMIFGQAVSAWTVIVFLLGMVFGFFIRHKI
jgi:hypothetical protein